MELFDEKIEQMILKKEYDELSAVEREGIQDFIANEEEYAQFRMTLLMSSDIQSENIQPKAETKASLMKMMEGSRPERKIWYNSIGVFFFPEDKPAFAKPGVYAALAAILLLVFFFVPMDFGTVETANQNVAANEDQMKDEAQKEMAPMEEEITATSEESIALEENKDDVSKSAEVNPEEDVDDVVLGGNIEREKANLDELNNELDDNIAFSMNEKGGGAANAANKSADGNTFTIDYSAGVYSRSANGVVAADSVLNAKPAAPGKVVASGDKTVNYKEDANGYISGDLKKDGFTYEILNDNPLNQNTNLIDLLYTAD